MRSKAKGMHAVLEGPIYQSGKGIQEILLYLYAEAIWPVTGQGFQNTKWPEVRYFQ